MYDIKGETACDFYIKKIDSQFGNLEMYTDLKQLEINEILVDTS